MICENDTIALILPLCLIEVTIWILEVAAFKNKTKKVQDHDEECEKGKTIIKIEKKMHLWQKLHIWKILHL